MGIRSLTPPTSRRGRQAKNLLTDKEREQVIKLLSEGKSAGPEQSFETEKVARREIGRWYREIKAAAPDLAFGSRCWVNENGEFDITLVPKGE